MQPFVSAMTSIREVLVAAIKSLLRGKSFIQAFFAFWVSPALLKTQDVETRKVATRRIADFLKEAEGLLLDPTRADGLKQLSQKFKAQFRDGLMSNPACMLPSYNHQLPDGDERGQYLALDVGGSTLRVAMVELRSQGTQGRVSEIIRMQSFKIDPEIKKLEGMEFFGWMADKIVETTSTSVKSESGLNGPLPVGLAWSFPIEQTSLKGGRICGMGKGFLAADGLLGQDLGDVIQRACQTRGLDVELCAIINDSTAALLSHAYVAPTTRFGLILGTGVNIAVHMPVNTIGPHKYGNRPDTWFEKASHVIVNTELGMFGKGVLPMTRWDEQLKDGHPRPDFQPLEHLVSGYYLGEILRFILIEAIETTGIFGGVVPPSLLRPYSLDTETLSLIEGDVSQSVESGLATFKAHHPSPVDPTHDDISALRTLASYVSRRSAAIVAASVFGLWELKAETESEFLRNLPAASPFTEETEAEMKIARTMVAFDGSVIERYPNYQTNCQKFIDDLVASVGGTPGSVDLVAAKESTLRGAAVALACVQEGRAN
ncbi:actin-like ATPase domain-containing protein [Thozetella sp. PMI_491]|nr:actin-like ATPase domain-containing protein [Thozetella sp. PMI_491]